MSFFDTHSHKIISYGIIAFICVFIVTASLWYKQEHKANDILEQGIALNNLNGERGFKEKSDAYYIDVTYPIVPGKVMSAGNLAIRNLYQARVDEFKTFAEKSFNLIPQSTRESNPFGYYNVYNVSFAKIAETKRYISLVALGNMTVFNDVSHTRNDIDTFIYDKETEKLVIPEDMFVGDTYLTLLSKVIRAQFEKQGVVLDWSLLEPTKANFSKLVPTKNGLMVYVGTYTQSSSSPYEQVIVPYSTLRTVINSKGVLADYK